MKKNPNFWFVCYSSQALVTGEAFSTSLDSLLISWSFLPAHQRRKPKHLSSMSHLKALRLLLRAPQLFRVFFSEKKSNLPCLSSKIMVVQMQTVQQVPWLLSPAQSYKGGGMQPCSTPHTRWATSYMAALKKLYFIYRHSISVTSASTVACISHQSFHPPVCFCEQF